MRQIQAGAGARPGIVIGLMTLGCVSMAAFGACGDTPEPPTGATSGPTGGPPSSSAQSSSSGAGGASSSSSSGSSTSSSSGTSCNTASSAASSSSSGSSSSSSGGDGGTPLNGCDPATALDLTGMITATITFPGSCGQLVYVPPCIKVSTGAQVTFMGDFTAHPLQAGVITSTSQTPDAPGTTPLPTTPVTSGTSETYVMQPAGQYGYYCLAHGALGMKGAIFVE